MTPQELNSTKEKFSKAYLYAVTAKLNYVVQEYSKDFDYCGFDYSIINKLVGESRSIASESSEIKIQLKCTSCSSESMFKDNGDFISYNLRDPINKLVQGRFYLVVVEVPKEEEFENWLEWTPDYLLIRKCGYYIEVENELKGKIVISKAKVFSPEQLPKLFG